MEEEEKTFRKYVFMKKYTSIIIHLEKQLMNQNMNLEQNSYVTPYARGPSKIFTCLILKCHFVNKFALYNISTDYCILTLSLLLHKQCSLICLNAWLQNLPSIFILNIYISSLMAKICIDWESEVKQVLQMTTLWTRRNIVYRIEFYPCSTKTRYEK